MVVETAGSAGSPRLHGGSAAGDAAAGEDPGEVEAGAAVEQGCLGEGARAVQPGDGAAVGAENAARCVDRGTALAVDEVGASGSEDVERGRPQAAAERAAAEGIARGGSHLGVVGR